MPQALIKLAFRHEINIQSSTSFEKDVFRDSYQEFLLQAQAYNREGKFRTLDEMISENAKANSLHYKVGFAVGLYISGLQNTIPGIKKLIPGLIQPSFESHHFGIIHSDIADRTQHQVVITYYTGSLTLLNSFGENLLLAMGDQSQLPAASLIDTFMIKPSAEVTICQYSDLPQTVPAAPVTGPSM